MTRDRWEDDGTPRTIAWAHEYDGYARLAGSPADLAELIEPAREAYARAGRIPGWCGVDLLRGWAFYLVRADRHSGGGTLRQEWRDVLDALRRHPATTEADLPPEPLLVDIPEDWRPMTGTKAREAVAKSQGTDPQFYRARRAPKGSAHEGVWYVEERPGPRYLDDCVWMVLPGGDVTRAVPVGNPMHPTSDLRP